MNFYGALRFYKIEAEFSMKKLFAKNIFVSIFASALEKQL